MDYFEKIEQKPKDDLGWNIPEQKSGTVNIIGGNSQSFRTEVKVSEFLANNYPVKTLNTILPNTLKTKLPNLPNFLFLSSLEAGSFDNKDELKAVLDSADYNLLLGDLSKNATTGRAVLGAAEITAKPLLITRDAVDLITDNGANKLLLNENVVLFASLAQLQKLLRSIYYPKMLLLSQSLVQVAEVLHKFTLSYPILIITIHSGQILVAKNGIVKAIPMEKSNMSMLAIWGGEMAGKIVAMNLYNPDNPINATIFAIFS